MPTRTSRQKPTDEPSGPFPLMKREQHLRGHRLSPWPDAGGPPACRSLAEGVPLTPPPPPSRAWICLASQRDELHSLTPECALL